MIVTAWNNGQHHPSGAGYGLKITVADRDRYFHREWRSVTLILEGQTQPIEINISKPSFWGETCHELISAEIGRWLKQNGLTPWAKGNPPKLVLEPMSERAHFHLRSSSKRN